jgi:hypothetical protein
MTANIFSSNRWPSVVSSASETDVRDGEPSRRNWAVGIIVLLLGAGLPILLLPPGPAALEQQLSLYVLTLMTLTMSVLWLAAMISRDTRAPFATVFWMFNYIAAGVVPLAELNTNIFTNLADRRYLYEAEGIFLVAAVAFSVGQLWPRSGQHLRKMDQALITDGWRLYALSIIAVLLSARYALTVGISTLFQSRGDVGAQIANAGLQAPNSQVGSAILTAFGTAPVFVCLLAHLIRSQNEARSRPSKTLWIVLLLSVNVIVNNPISNARYWVLTILVGILFAMRGMSWARYVVIVVVGIAAALVIFPYADVTRSSNSLESGVTVVPIAEKLSTKDYDQLTMTANGVWWVGQVGHANGHQLLSSVAFWIPREVWPGKGLDTGVAIGLAIHSANVNLSSPLPLEFWVDFGFGGVVVSFALFGILCRQADRSYIRGLLSPEARPTMSHLAVPILAGYGFILMRGPLLQSMSRMSVLLLFIVLLVELPATRGGYRRFKRAPGD